MAPSGKRSSVPSSRRSPVECIIAETAWGNVRIEGKSEGLTGISLTDEPVTTTPVSRAFRAHVDTFLAECSSLTFTVPVILEDCTPFQRDVLDVLREIPRGNVMSYQEIAERVGRPRAFRAVGNAVAANPVPLVIPCHRVVRKDRSLGGFSFGSPEVKAQLLAMEGARVGIQSHLAD